MSSIDANETDAHLLIEIVRWRIFETDEGERHFVGRRLDKQTGYVSQAIMQFDPSFGQGDTASGDVVQLIDRPGSDGDADLAWHGWALSNGVEARDVTAETYEDMLDTNYERNERQVSTPRLIAPSWRLHTIPDDFPVSRKPTRRYLDGRSYAGSTKVARLHQSNFCLGLAQALAENLNRGEVDALRHEDLLRNVVCSWDPLTLDITPEEFVWIVKRAADILGWQCSSRVFEIRTEIHCWINP